MVNNMIARQVDGLIVASCMRSDADYLKLSEQLPVVLFDRSSDSALPLVMTDSVAPTTRTDLCIAPQHADEFWFLGGQPQLSPSRDRLAGLPKAWLRRGTLRPEWVINGNITQLRLRDVRRALRSWSRTAAEGAVPAPGLRPAGRVLRYIGQHHLLDSNIHLASFDDHYLYDSLSLRIDTVQQG